MNNTAKPQNMWKIAQAVQSTTTKSILRSSLSNFNTNYNENITTICSKRFLSTQFEQNPEEKKGDRLTNILTRVIDAKPRVPPKPTKEEAERRHTIGRNYVIGNFKKNA